MVLGRFEQNLPMRWKKEEMVWSTLSPVASQQEGLRASLVSCSPAIIVSIFVRGGTDWVLIALLLTLLLEGEFELKNFNCAKMREQLQYYLKIDRP